MIQKNTFVFLVLQRQGFERLNVNLIKFNHVVSLSYIKLCVKLIALYSKCGIRPFNIFLEYIKSLNHSALRGEIVFAFMLQE